MPPQAPRERWPVTIFGQNARLKAATRLILVTDDIGRSAGQLARIVAEALAGGATMVHLRERRATPRQARSALKAVAGACLAAGVPLMLNGAMARGLGPWAAEMADGVWWGKATWIPAPRPGTPSNPPDGPDPPDDALQPPLAAYSAHSTREAAMAIAGGADFVSLSPVYDTPGKAGIIPTAGTRLLTETRTALGPAAVLVALGGIDETNAAATLRAGADGVAVMRAIMDSTDPRAAARRLREAMDRAGEACA